MNPERKVIWQHSTPVYNRSFLQPFGRGPRLCRLHRPHPDDGTHRPSAERADPQRFHGRSGDAHRRGGRAARRGEHENHDPGIAEGRRQHVRTADRAGHLTADLPDRQDRCDGARDRQPLEAGAFECGVYPSVCRGKEPLASRGPQCLGTGHLHEPEPSGRAFPSLAGSP